MQVTHHILLVDNDEVTLELSRRFLENAGLNVRTASRSSEALEMLSNPGLRLVVSEVELRHLNGFDLMSIMRKCQIHVPVVFLSNADDVGTRLEAEQLGAAGFLSKQADFGELPKVVAGVLSDLVSHSPTPAIRIA